MGVTLSKEQRTKLARAAPAVLLLWRRVLTSLLLGRMPKRQQLLQSLLYSALLASPALASGVWERIRRWTGASQRVQNMVLMTILQNGCGLIPPMATLFECSSNLFRASAALPHRLERGALERGAWPVTSGMADFALTYFCSFSLIFFYNEFPDCYLPFYRKNIRVLSGEAFSAWNVTTALPQASGLAVPAASAASDATIGGWALNADPKRKPVHLPLYREFGVAAEGAGLLRHMQSSIPTFAKMLMFFQIIVKPLLRAKPPAFTAPLRALRTTLALQGAGATHYILNRWFVWGSTNPLTIWAARMVAAVFCSLSAAIDSPNEVRPMLCVMLANMLYAYLNLATKLTTGSNGPLFVTLFEYAYPLAAMAGVLRSPLIDTVAAALQP